MLADEDDDDDVHQGSYVSMNALNKVRQFLADESGPTAVEYAVMLALIIVACITIVRTLGTTASTTFNSVNTELGGTSG